MGGQTLRGQREERATRGPGSGEKVPGDGGAMGRWHGLCLNPSLVIGVSTALRESSPTVGSVLE